MIPTLFGIMFVTFVITQFVPGGPVERMMAQIEGHGAGGEATSGGTRLYQGNKGLDQERVEQLKKLYGFDQPPLTRFVRMMGNYLLFDFGESYYHHRGVVDLVVSKLPVSMSLGLWSFLIVYSVCIPLGIAKAMRDGSRFDVFTSTVILVGYAIPGFVLGIVLIVLFGGGSFWNIFPLRGLVSDNWSEFSMMGKVLDYLWH
ncbi:MAG: ABC transporter permease subunit, partial [Desulfobulbaceae bacterium]|nr:ABC transporter permease subunit [Desulfobulbaceae bacterium]